MLDWSMFSIRLTEGTKAFFNGAESVEILRGACAMVSP